VRIIAISNQKGGVGKSTTAANLGAALVRAGRRVLLVDLDPQANLTYSILGRARAQEVGASVYDVLKGDKKPSEAVLNLDGLPSLLPATIRLAGADIALAGVPGREQLLKDAMGEERGPFDFILIDCPPSLGLLTLNALTFAKEIFIPLQLEFLALQGMDQLIDTVEIVRKRLNKSLRITGIIGTRYNRRALNNDAIELVKKKFPGLLFDTLIRENIALAEAPAQGQTIFDYRPDSHGAEDYAALCKEVTTMEDK